MKKARVTLALIVALVMAAQVIPAYADTEYDAHDVSKLVAFFEITDGEGVKNGDKLFENYDPDDPETWTGAEWTGSPKKLRSIEFHGSYETGMVSGTLDLEGCSELVSLNCGWSGVSGVNADNCTKLESLTVRSNGCSEGISVSNCSRLTELDARECSLTELDLSDCQRLSSLNVEENGLTELDLTGCPLLTVLHAQYNSLETIDLSNNVMLSELYLNGNLLTSLDTSACAPLSRLFVAGNQLTSLDLSENTAIRYLDCSETLISEIDLDGCSSVEYVRCVGSPLIYFHRHNTMFVDFTIRTEGGGRLDFEYAFLGYTGGNYIHTAPAGDEDFIGWFDGETGLLISSSYTLSGYDLIYTNYIARYQGFAPPGDANLDGTVDISDALFTLRCAMGLLNMNDQQQAAADINGDGAVNLQDALLILRSAMGLL